MKKIPFELILIISAIIGGLSAYGDSIQLNNICYHGSIVLCDKLRNLYNQAHVGTFASIGDVIAISIWLLEKRNLIKY